MTSVVFGAYATQMLGDLGADVIKVEFPGGRRGGGGDIMRWAGHPPEGAAEDLGPIFVTLNRNKRSVLLDLRQKFLRRRRCAPSWPAATFRRLGSLRGPAPAGPGLRGGQEIRGDIIYVHAAGYGARGPYAGEPAYDDLIQSASGLADLLPRVDGDPTPRLIPTLVADKVSGLFMTQAITAPFSTASAPARANCRNAHARVRHQLHPGRHFYGHVYDPPTGPWAYTRVANPQRKPFRTKDGYIGLLPYTDQQWDQFFAVAGWADTFGKDPRFADYKTRARHVRELYALVEEVTPRAPRRSGSPCSSRCRSPWCG